ATSGPLATISFTEQNGINGIRLIGNGAGSADGNGFIGVNEFEVLGVPQELSLEVDLATGFVEIVNSRQGDISFDYYEIASSGHLLNLAGWNSLQDPSENVAGFPAGSGGGNGWEALGVPNSGMVAEGYLTGSSILHA